MSILEKIRRRSGLAIVFVGGALALFIITDALQNNSRLFGGSQSTDVGEINGEAISYKSFEAQVAKNTEAARAQMGPDGQMDQNTIDMVREQTWSQMIMDGVMSSEFEGLGIKVTEDELFDLVQGEDPHPQIKSAPIFQNQQTGQFDRTLVIRFLKDLETRNEPEAKKQWLAFEDGLLKETESKKYYALIKKGVYATSLEAKALYKNRSRAINADAIALNYFSIADSTIKAEESELMSYMKKNEKKYAEREDSRRLEFIIFDAVASAQDSASAKKWADEQVTQFANAANDTLYVNANSEVPFDPTAKNRKQYPEEIAGRLFSEPVGTIIGPVFSEGKYNIYKIIGTKTDSLFQMRASHILFKIDNGDTAATMKKATDVLNQIRRGADFGAMAAQYGTDGTASKGGDLGWFIQGDMVKEFQDAVAAGKKGDLKIVKTQFGIHIIKVTEDKSNKLVCAGVVSRGILPSDATVGGAYNNASSFVAAVSNLETFKAKATENGYNIFTAEYVRQNDKQVGGRLTDAREMVRWSFNAKKDQVSEVFTLGDKFVVAVLTNIREKGKADFETAKSRVETDYRKSKKAEQLLEKAKVAMAGAANIQAIASKLQLSVTPLTNQTFENNNIAYVGPDNKMVGTLFGTATKGKISGPVEGDNAVYIFVINSVVEAPEIKDFTIYRNEVQTQLSNRVEYATFETLKELRNVVDNRYKF
ncbi:MAG: SurA N-terminal domain-containing protein [Bacteroidia bacterium]|jgi:peptidyl-prolyl cis-trans isomerase D|nr:SurA N-terminal domain-containing protein [Bacteroidia bacterium]